MKKNPILVILVAAAVLSGIFFVLLLAASLVAGRKPGALPVVGSDVVALVKVEGLLVSSERIVDELNEYADDSSVKAIVIRIDSPGGGVVPSQEIYDAIRNARKEHKKKIVVSMGSVAASGGYYIAAAADKIIANPGTLTGSIGVKMEFANVEKLLDKIGVKGMVLKAGEYKDIGSPFRNMTEQEKKLLQHVLDDVHDQFIEAVAKGRNLPIASVREIADGRIFTGRQALDLKLVDQLGDLSTSIKVAADLAGIKGKPKIVTKEKKIPFFEYFKEESAAWMSKVVTNVLRDGMEGSTAQLRYLYRP